MLSRIRYSLSQVTSPAVRASFWSGAKKGVFHDPNPNAAEAQKLITSLQNPTATHPDIITAAELAQKAVEEGSPRGKTLLGSLHREGFAVTKDLARAEKLFLEASESGDPYAQCSLGVLKLSSLKPKDPHDEPDFDVSVAVDDKGELVASRLESVNNNNNNDTDNADDENNVIESDGDDKGKKKKKKSKEGFETPAELVRRVRKERKKAGFTDAQAREFEEYKDKQEEQRKDTIRKNGIFWLERAVEQGHEAAMLALAQEVAKTDPKRTVELFERAANEHRSLDAYYALGQIYERGIGDIVERDLRVSFRHFSMGAQLGDASAQLYMGHLYRAGSFVVNVDWLLARQYIEMAVEQNHPPALHYFALMHRNGECGMEVNEEEFLKHMTKSAELGYAPALMSLADVYYQGSDGMEVDYLKALDLFTRAGKLGEIEATCSAAAMYFHGTGIEQDYVKAFELYQEAAVKGSVNAMRNLSSMYFYGQGVPANKTLSEHFMNVADDMEKQRKEREKVDPDQVMSEPTPQGTGVTPKPRAIPATTMGKEKDEEEGSTNSGQR